MERRFVRFPHEVCPHTPQTRLEGAPFPRWASPELRHSVDTYKRHRNAERSPPHVSSVYGGMSAAANMARRGISVLWWSDSTGCRARQGAVGNKQSW